MLSVADIPMAGFHFQGVIGIVLWHGREYRLATYLGAKAVMVQNGLVRVVQGSLELEAELLERTGKPLKAPTRGDMARTIHESVACRASYRFRKNNHTLLAFETDRASLSMSIRNEGGRDRQKLRTVIYNELKCIDIMYGRQKFVAFRGEKRYIIAIEDYEV